MNPIDRRRRCSSSVGMKALAIGHLRVLKAHTRLAAHIARGTLTLRLGPKPSYAESARETMSSPRNYPAKTQGSSASRLCRLHDTSLDTTTIATVRFIRELSL